MKSLFYLGVKMWPNMLPILNATGVIGGGVSNPTYAELLRDEYGASEIWPLVDIASGTTLSAFIDPARNGTLVGWDLQNAAGAVPGTLAPYLDGVNDYGDILTENGSTGLVDIFDYAEGSIFMWIKHETWTGITDYVFNLRVDNSNRMIIFIGAANRVEYHYIAGGVDRTIFQSGVTGSWHSVGISWSVSGNATKFYFDGAQLGATQGAPGTFVGTPSIMSIGSYSGNTFSWLGWLSYCALKFGSVWSNADFQAMHDAASTAGGD